jgi:Na+/proline symporter/signal transduction histidine kinase/CheY-like chemotaxis protein
MYALLALVAAFYGACLFALAWKADRTTISHRRAGLIYALTLGVFCTSWTYFGAVGTAVADGWSYLPIYLGPALVFLFARDFLQRLAETVRRENLTSVSDFISARFGKSRIIAALVTVITVLGVAPYIALQLKALAGSASILAGAQTPSPTLAFAIAAALAVFAVMFGARSADTTGENKGLLAVIAVESIIKLFALLVLALFAIGVFIGLPKTQQDLGLSRFAAVFSWDAIGVGFITTTLLACCAIICLPRQFYVGFVEYRDSAHLKRAFWILPVYMALTSLVAPPIALAGLAALPSSAAPDFFVIHLPLAADAQWLALLVFVGGLSAATGMVIVEAVALSTMIVNDLVAPVLLHYRALSGARDIGALLLLARRIAIMLVIGLALVYMLAIQANAALASIGLISFAAVAQFAPCMIGALYWPNANRTGALWGLTAGGLIWFYTLFLPAYLPANTIDALWTSTILDGGLHPQKLFGFSLGDPLTHGTVWSLLANILFFIMGSRLAQPSVEERMRTPAFAQGARTGAIGAAATLGDLRALVERFVGADSDGALELAGAPTGAPINPHAAQWAERQIATVIGASSARVIMASALRRGAVDVADVATLLDGARAELSFSKELLGATLDNISQGVSVVDKNLRLVAWNRRYLELFDFPPGFIQVGMPIADVIRYNALRGECGPGEVDSHVERRLANLRRGVSHNWERVRPDGAVLKSTGNPMPGGGYVTSFTDITSEKRAQAALEEVNALLEERVAARTSELAAANTALSAAKQAAEAATLGKTKFLAAASHDLLQPLNAARLFLAALDRQSQGGEKPLVGAIDRSIAAADSLLRALLDISRLEAGGVQANPNAHALDDLLSELAQQYGALAADKGLEFAYVKTSAVAFTDVTLLRSAMQNFLSNAVRYTKKGRVLLGVRAEGDRWRIEVWDTGPGLAEDKLSLAFQEFKRLESSSGESGAGLGLSIVERLSRVLDAPVTARSWEGRGSMFAISVARISAAAPLLRDKDEAPQDANLAGLRILCVDDDSAILESLQALMRTLEAGVTIADTYADAINALDRTLFDVALVDFQLGGDKTGIDLIDWAKTNNLATDFVVISADNIEAAKAARKRGAHFLQKPVNPGALRALLETLRRKHMEAHATTRRPDTI